MIEARGISHTLGGEQVLKHVSFEAAGGEHIALVGPNGAGKSTLLQVLAGVIQPGAGDVFVGNTNLSEMDITTRAQTVSYLAQQRELVWDLRVEDVAALGRFAWGGRRYAELSDEARAPIDRALKLTGAQKYFARSMRTLSGGEQARVHLARALSAGTEILLMDEPFAALDLRFQLELMSVLEAERARGALVITVLHDLQLAERFATRLIALNAGRVTSDGPAPLQDDILRETFGLIRREHGGFEQT